MFNWRRSIIKVLDFYFVHAFWLDLLLAILLILITHKILGCIPSGESLNDSTSTIIDNSVSLAGFILAALTIIVSFRASVISKLSEAGTIDERKAIEDRMNGLELLLASNKYYILTDTFKSSLKELIFTFALLGSVHLYSDIIPDKFRFYLLQAGYIFTYLAISRSLYILFRALAVEESQSNRIN